ncbi:XRE family transcriptional regulator [Streptomyces sp.]|uniref:XRE family transcriptional regulator n=1 Tax=Streptomyces sp. TaxID=1931 RepID=UPI002D689AD1|nr:XRE family transcriptional regulator [Streptomyces sp.]HZF92099.1 XRE family transcriptional regulator [Streptomyces sp.]
MTAEAAGAPRTDLSDLVRQRMQELGLSFRTLADACIDPENPEDGPLWRRSTIDALSKGQRIKAPDFPQLRALAAGLRVPIWQVQEAAGSQFLHIDTVWSADGRVRALVEGFREMSREDQDKVMALMESRRQVRQR